MIEQGVFRKDLYFRLGVIKVQVPSLNERWDDILPMARHFLYKFSRKFGKTFSGISPRAESALMAHDWTGNVRELKNIIERGVLIGKGGKALKKVGSLAREDIEHFLDRPVFLELQVQMKKKWRKDSKLVTRFGY